MGIPVLFAMKRLLVPALHLCVKRHRPVIVVTIRTQNLNESCGRMTHAHACANQLPRLHVSLGHYSKRG